MTLNTFLKGTAITSVFAVLIVPFIVFGNFFFPFITGKAFFFRIVVEIGFAAWLLLTFRDVSVRPRKSLVLWSFVSFLVVIGLADIFGMNPWKSFWSNFERMEGYVTLLHLGMYFIMSASVLATEKLWKLFLEGSVVSSIIISLYSFFQLAGALVINQGGVRADATFGNATYLAIYLVFNIFFALILAARYSREKLNKAYTIGLYSGIGFVMFYIWIFMTATKVFDKGIPNISENVFWIYMVLVGLAVITWLSQKFSSAIIYLYTVPMFVFVLYHTATRGSILGLLGGLLLSALLIALFDKKEKRLRIVAGSVVGAVILVALGFIAIRNTDFVANSPVLTRFASISWNETKTQARAYIWPMAIEGWKENPVLGWGQENFNYIFNEHYDPRMYSQEQWFDHTHNIVLDWLVAGGLLGLIAYLSLFVTALYLLWKKATTLSFTEKALFTGLGAAYFFHNLFVFDNLVSYILFVSVLAYIHFMGTRLEKPVAVEASEIDESDTRTAGPIILVALVFALYFFNGRAIGTSSTLIDALRAATMNPIQAEATLASFKEALSYNTLGRPEVVERIVEASRAMNTGNVSIETRQKFFDLAKNAVDDQITRYPEDARYEVFAANFYSIYGVTADAEAHALKAVELSPRKQTILFQLGSIYLSQKKYDKAAEIFKRAYDLEPKYEDALKYYAASLIYTDKEADARALMDKAGLTGSAFDDAFVPAYADLGKWDKVIAIMKSKIVADPKNPQNRMNLVSAYFQSGNKVAAVATLREMIILDPAFKATGEQYIQQIMAQ